MVTTISVDEEVKNMLERIKGDRDWNSFLKDLLEDYLTLKREKVRKELGQLFVSELGEVRVRKWAREF